MATHVISDLHLDDASGAALFRDDRQGRSLQRLARRLRDDDDAELIVLGDGFDITAMLPPAKGMERFARALDLPLDASPPRSVHALLEATRRTNPRAIAALAKLCERIPVTFVPGNHDRVLADAAAREALAAIGLGRAKIEPWLQRTIGERTVVLLHGHEWDRANATANGPGEVMTRALNQAAIPFLRHHGARHNVKMDPDRLVALRPEERMIVVLERWLDRATFYRLFRAFLDLLADNGYLPPHLAWMTRGIMPATVHRALERERPLWDTTAHRALNAMAGGRPLPVGAGRADVVVAGHTHVIDWAVQRGTDCEQLYVNLGTWTERTTDASSRADTTLPVLSLGVDAHGAFCARFADLDAGGREMQRFETRAEPALRRRVDVGHDLVAKGA